MLYVSGSSGAQFDERAGKLLDGMPGSKVMTFWLTPLNELAGYSSW